MTRLEKLYRKKKCEFLRTPAKLSHKRSKQFLEMQEIYKKIKEKKEVKLTHDK